MTEFAVTLQGVTDDARRKAADHLRESVRLLTSQLERLDMAYFRLSREQAKISTPVTKAAALVAEALAGPGARLKVTMPNLSTQDLYVLSEFFAASARRAEGNWMDPASAAADVISRIQADWDRQFGIHGDPADRAHMRTAAAYRKQPRRAAVNG